MTQVLSLTEEEQQQQRQRVNGRFPKGHQINKGLKRSETHKQIMRDYWLGRKRSDENRRRLSEAKRGKKHSEQARIKMRISALRRWAVRNGFKK